MLNVAALVVALCLRLASRAGAEASSGFLTGGHALFGAAEDAVDKVIARFEDVQPGGRAGKEKEKMKKKKDTFEKRFGFKNPFDTEKEVGPFGCGETFQTTQHDVKDHTCPAECPLYVQNKKDDNFCTFVCVKAEECTSYNPKATIASEEEGICRTPNVQYCKQYSYAGKDTCEVCDSFYYLGEDNLCHFSYMWAIYLLGAVGILLVVVLVLWVVDLFTRKTTNAENLVQALGFRSRQKIRMKGVGEEAPIEDGTISSTSPRIQTVGALYPLTTNLLRTNVAGAGMQLHFNFQFIIIVWSLLVGLGWCYMGLTIDENLFILGKRKFGTPRDNCILVAWGWRTQQRLMWTKVHFVFWVYILSFIGALLHGVRQLRMFQSFDFENKTMKDFVLMLDGLPQLPGKQHVEEDLKKQIEEVTGEEVVGVSVAWAYKEHEEAMMNAVKHDLSDLQKKYGQDVTFDADPDLWEQRDPSDEEATKDLSAWRKKFWNFEKTALVPDPLPDETEEERVTRIKKILDDLYTCPNSFVVFKTEASRNRAELAIRDKGLKVKGPDDVESDVTAETIINEADTIQWQNFTESTNMDKVVAIFKGFGCIFLALFVWTVVFYLPYAASIQGFNYDNGQQPPAAYGLAFTMVVVIGNAIMYQVCAFISDFVGFRFRDDTEACYMILYTVACSFNIVLDFVMTYKMAEKIQEELGFRTWDGKHLKDIHRFTEKFETYAMQRTLAENNWLYAFPSTFLIPFLIEPIATIIAPLKICLEIVRSHPEIYGFLAEDYIACFPMDMGRYSDILLNVLLSVLIFYFPGGYTHQIFLAMAASHVWIYLFDQYKVLRAIPSCTYASMRIDFFSQAMLAPLIGMCASCLVFKANCHGYGFCIKGTAIPVACTVAFVVHCILHLTLLNVVVPMFGRSEPDESEELKNTTYQDVHERIAASWFNTNPVFCLRSKYVFEHSTPCFYYISGKDHLLQLNPDIGCHYMKKAGEIEDYSRFGHVPSMHKVKVHKDVDKMKKAGGV